GDTELSSGPVDPTIVDTTDEAGRASLTFTVPEGVYGEQQLTVAVADAGTNVQVPVTFADAPEAEGTITLSAITVEAGGTVTVNGSGFEAGLDLAIMLRSTPVEIGTATVASDGEFTVTVTIPKGTSVG